VDLNGTGNKICYGVDLLFKEQKMGKNAKLYTLCIIVIGITMLLININEAFVNIDFKEVYIFIFLR